MKIALTRLQAGRISGAQREIDLLNAQAQAVDQQASRLAQQAQALRQQARAADLDAVAEVCAEHQTLPPKAESRYVMIRDDAAGTATLEWETPAEKPAPPRQPQPGRPFGVLAPSKHADACPDQDCPDSPHESTKPEDAAVPAVAGAKGTSSS
jgi:hypothetical protein